MPGHDFTSRELLLYQTGFDPNSCGEPTHKITEDLQSSIDFHIFKVRLHNLMLTRSVSDDSTGFLP